MNKMRFKSFPKFQKEFCKFCRENRALAYCTEEAKCPDCPWKGKEPLVRYPGDDTMKICACCGKNIYIPEEMSGYIYRKQHYTSAGSVITDYYCGWNCMRKEEKEVDRLYRDLNIPRPYFRSYDDDEE